MFVADTTRYGKMLEELENYFTKRSNNYPSTAVTSAYNLLVNYKNYQRPASIVFLNQEESI
jgi:hypothetical protein